MNRIRLLAASAAFGFAAVASAQVDMGHPKDATALCKDGTFYSGSDQAMACSRNGGVQEWWGTVRAPEGRAGRKEGAGRGPARTLRQGATPEGDGAAGGREALALVATVGEPLHRFEQRRYRIGFRPRNPGSRRRSRAGDLPASHRPKRRGRASPHDLHRRARGSPR